MGAALYRSSGGCRAPLLLSRKGGMGLAGLSPNARKPLGECSVPPVSLVARLLGLGVLAAVGRERAPDIVRFAEFPAFGAELIALVALVRLDQFALAHGMSPSAARTARRILCSRKSANLR